MTDDMEWDGIKLVLDRSRTSISSENDLGITFALGRSERSYLVFN